MEEIREQALNNFMLSPWVMPYGQEDDDGSLSPAVAKPVQNPVAKPTVVPQ